ncbi:MAG TPA: adenylate/guanylate cyclase domain-containing protein [Solimonas sp.]|nr:adenylate/guanylate cyclase domain-containing protein [Solimonas sp.]
MAELLVLSLAALLALLGFLLRREQQCSARLRRRLELMAAELQQLQQSCARLAPAGLVQRLASEQDDEALAEHKQVTALFADLVGYTALSEKLDAPQLARVLNGYFERAADAIGAHRGHLSTFLGDGVLAYFGALEPNPWQCNDAVRAALQMRAALRAYSEELQREGLPPVAVGIGIHYGSGLAGLIGSRDRREYSVVGRTVNLAARVQGLTRPLGVDILVTDEVRAELDPAIVLRAMPAQAVKGIALPVVTYAVEDTATALATD